MVESLALGIDKWKLVIIDALKKVLAEDGIVIRGVYERSDAKVRLQEGMERYKGFIGEPFDTKVEIVENGVHYMVDVEDGQKTGFSWIRRITVPPFIVSVRIKGAGLLHTHRLLCIERGNCRSEECSGCGCFPAGCGSGNGKCEAERTGNTVSFRCADVFELLPELEAQGEKYDVVILDPPAFTKSRNSIKNAVKGYREINLRGLKLVKDGGFLVTCSCSHFMDPELFAKTIREASHGAHKRLRQVEFKTQGPDHPILWAADESYYLKFYIFQVVDEK